MTDIDLEMNIFMQYIYNKINFKFFKLIPYWIHKYKVKKFKNMINEGSPDFDTLWQMADFIKLSEMVFCYNNNVKNTDIGLYSSKNYEKNTNGFRVIGNNCEITIKLFSKSKQVALEVARTNGDKSRTAINFKNNQWEINQTKYDEMLLEQVIKAINKNILMLFDYCYNLR